LVEQNSSTGGGATVWGGGTGERDASDRGKKVKSGGQGTKEGRVGAKRGEKYGKQSGGTRGTPN